LVFGWNVRLNSDSVNSVTWSAAAMDESLRACHEITETV
jgi:hypothetical protein